MYYLEELLSFYKIPASIENLPFILNRNMKKIAVDNVKDIWDSISASSCPGTIMKPVMPRGNVFADILIVAQNPGGRGNREYSTIWSDGPNSKFVINCVKEAQIYKNAWFTNVVPFPTNDNKINKNQIEAVSYLLKKQVEVIKPKVLISLGSISGKTLNKMFKDIPIIELYHPAYVRRFLSGDINNKLRYIEEFSSSKQYLY